MSNPANTAEQVTALKAEVARLTKVNAALMNRVERSTDAAGSSYSLFESNLLLQSKLNEHTHRLLEINQVLQREIGERKRAEEALRKERDFTSAVLDTAGALVVVLDREGRIVHFNRTCERTTGYRSADVLGRPFWDVFLVPEEIDRIKEVFASLRAGLFPSQAENFWLTKEGEKRLIAWSNTALVDADGVVEHIIGTGIDVTEAKEANRAVETRLRYEEGLAACSRALLDADNEAEAIARALEHLRKASDAGRAYIFENFEDPTAGLCARQIYEICAPGVETQMDDPVLQHIPYTDALAPWREILEQNTPLAGPVRSLSPEIQKIVEPGGVLSLLVLPIWVNQRWYGFIGFDEVRYERSWGEEEVRLLTTAADMIGGYLARRQALEALRVSEERFRSLVENANDVIYSLDPKGGITYLSPKFEDYTGYRARHRLGQSVLELLDEQDVPAAREWFSEIAAGAHRHTGYEWRLRHKDGNLRWFVSNSSVIRDEEGEVQEIVGVAHDITGMKKLVEDLEEANRSLRETHAQLLQSEKMASLGRLVAGVAHEINTPTGSVASMHDTLMKATTKLCDLIASECPKESDGYQKFQRILATMDDANRVIKMGTERITTIVRRLRSFARLDEAELVEADIHDGLEDTLTLVHHELKHNIVVHRQFGTLPKIHCYMASLNQVFVNMLINAKQAIPGKGDITITTFHRNGQVYIQFADTGIGIPKENLVKIFDPGYTTKGVGVGTGLGLSICYQIVQDHHGQITVESEVGKGTTFTIMLPTNLKEILGVS